MTDTKQQPARDRRDVIDDLDRYALQTHALIVALSLAVDGDMTGKYVDRALWLADEQLERIKGCIDELVEHENTGRATPPVPGFGSPRTAGAVERATDQRQAVSPSCTSR